MFYFSLITAKKARQIIILYDLIVVVVVVFVDGVVVVGCDCRFVGNTSIL